MSKALPPDLRAAVLEQAKRTPSPDAARTRRAAAVAIAVGAGLALAAFAPFGPALGGRSLAFVAVSAAGWALIALSASVLAGMRGKTMLGPARWMLTFVAIAAGPAIFTWVIGCTLGFPVGGAAGTLRAHVACFFVTSIFSLGPLAALAFLRRGSDPVHPRATGAAIGAAAGAWGGVLIDLHCPLTGPLHVALGHVLPVVIWAALGALAGSRLFGVRARISRAPPL